MSVSMSKANGVTVLSMNSDPESVCPPLCQIFKSLCYSPVCCSSSQHLRTVQRTSQSALGALQIIVGLLNMGLAPIFLTMTDVYSYWWWTLAVTLYPFWLGGLFILFGIVSILSEKFPSPCLVIVNVILNLVGVAFAVTAIVLYSINMGETWFNNTCYSGHSWYSYDHYPMSTTAPPSSEEMIMKRRCMDGNILTYTFQRSINALLIVLSVLELCLVISSAVLGIKALRARGKGGNKNNDEPEVYKPHLEEVTTNPAI